jgi:malonyl-CoA/methylmalonyl-CoA synthetase
MLYLACLRAGAVYLPLNIGYTLAELEYYIGDAEPRVVVCAPERHVALAPVATKLGVAAVETLGTHQDGTILDLAKSQSSDFKDVPRAARRRDLPVHAPRHNDDGRADVLRSPAAG